ncbi:MAG: hypothetical protein IPL23_12860 [Saprospiraceae bacterium]|nr:hypothetical protein [Saprospiraceae bacterium]
MEKKQTKSNFNICTNYSINEVFNDSILENSIRLEYFNEMSEETVIKNSGRPFIRLMFFDEIDTCSIISFQTKDNCSIVEIKRSSPKFFNLINFDPGMEHNLYQIIEYNYKRKVLNFYKYENVINLIKNDLKQIPFTKPEKFVIIEIFDGAKYEKYFQIKLHTTLYISLLKL